MLTEVLRAKYRCKMKRRMRILIKALSRQILIIKSRLIDYWVKTILIMLIIYNRTIVMMINHLLLIERNYASKRS
jgi:hypothetical protein